MAGEGFDVAMLVILEGQSADALALALVPFHLLSFAEVWNRETLPGLLRKTTV